MLIAGGSRYSDRAVGSLPVRDLWHDAGPAHAIPVVERPNLAGRREGADRYGSEPVHFHAINARATPLFAMLRVESTLAVLLPHASTLALRARLAVHDAAFRAET